jgi:hypothetical protein
MVWVLILCALAGVSSADGEAVQTTTQPHLLNHAGIYGVRELDPVLTGSGVKIAVICRSMTYNADGEPQYDYRPNTKHNCFLDTQITFLDDADQQVGISPHSTAICSILFGQEQGGYYPAVGDFSFEGIVPSAEAEVYEFWHFSFNYVLAGLVPDADVVTASIGSRSEDWWTRGIESMVEQYGLIVVAGIGNGSDVQDPPLYPGAGANVIGVGVVDSVNSADPAISLSQIGLAYPEHSSVGPTTDGRCKPDIVAPSNYLAADDYEPNGYEPTGNWSSFSTPVVAGTVGLLVQKAVADANLSSALSPRGGNCVIKAILLNSATKLPYWHKGRLGTDDDHHAPLDYVQGAGMLNAMGAYSHLIAGESNPGDVPNVGWDLGHLDKSMPAFSVYRINVAQPANKVITVTIGWHKHYNDVYPFESLPEKDANLRLEVWAVNPDNPDEDYLLDYSDSNVDNVEHVHCSADANYSSYEIVVSHASVAEANEAGQMQSYGLAWNVSEMPKGKGIAWYDLTADGIVDARDTDVFIDNLFIEYGLTGGEPVARYVMGDITGDGKIDQKDWDELFEAKGITADWWTK